MVKTVFAQLPEEMQKTLTTSAGIVLNNFDPNMELGTAETAKATLRKALMFATSGGVNVTLSFEVVDGGEDVDNAPKNTKELAEYKSAEVKMSGTALTLTADTAISFMGAADKSGSEVVTIKPRLDLKLTDFKAIWYVCPYGTDGGFIAIKIDNALSTGGFNFQSEDDAKGKFSFEYTGFASIDAPDKVPFEFYMKASAVMPAKQVQAEVKGA